MIHDVLLALLGFTGDIVEIDQDTQELVLADRVKLAAFDRDIVEGLLQLGSMYMRIRDWLDRVISDSNANVYEVVVARTLHESILSAYEDEVAEWEATLLEWSDSNDEKGGITLSTIRLELWKKWWTSFHLVQQLVDPPPETGFDRCLIDRVIELYDGSKDVHVGEICVKLVECFKRELICWCTHGIVAGGRDRSRFFIRFASMTAPVLGVGDEVDLDHISKFQIDRSRIPTRLVSEDTCTQILFCGRAVLVLGLSAEEKSNGGPLQGIECVLDSLRVKYDIQAAVEKVRTVLSERLAVRLKDEMKPGLVQHIRALRDTALLGNGQKWYSCISHEGIMGETFSEIFETENKLYNISLSAGMEIQYSPMWPLDLVLTKERLVKFNSVFRVLLIVTRADLRARQLGVLEMTHFFTSLLAYIQTDVIETHFVKLMRITRASSDIEEIARALDQFLNLIHTECLLCTTSVADHVQSLTTLLSEMMAKGNHPEAVLSSDRGVRVIRQLLDELESLQTRPLYRCATKLILRLNFNEYYSEIGNHSSQ